MRTSSAVLLLPMLALLSGCATPRYLAKVDGHEIDPAELKAAFAHVHKGFDRALTDERDVRRVLDLVIDRRLLIDEGYRLALDQDPAVHEAMARELEEQLVNAITRDELETNAAVTPAEVQDAYALSATMLKVRRIVVETREEAEALRARALAGESFEALARERSIDGSSAVHGGLMPPVWWGQVAEDRERLLFSTPKGSVTPPIEAESGWALDLVEDRLEGEKQALDAVEPAIRELLQRRKREARRVQVLSELRARYGLELAACEPTPERLRAALDREDQTPCATWRGGALTLTALARLTSGKIATGERDRVVQARADLALLAAEARARGYATRPEIRAAVEAVKETAIENTLYREHVYRGLAATEEEVEAYWAANPQEFTEPERLLVAHVATSSLEDAERVRAQALAGAPFEDLARTSSIDRATAAAGGIAGTFTRAQLEGTFAALATLGKGEISPVMPNKTWFHVAQVVEVHPERLKPFAEVSGEARRKLLDARARERALKWITRLRGDATVTVNDAAVRAFAREKQAELERELADDPENPAARARPDPAADAR